MKYKILAIILNEAEPNKCKIDKYTIDIDKDHIEKRIIASKDKEHYNSVFKFFNMEKCDDAYLLVNDHKLVTTKTNMDAFDKFCINHIGKGRKNKDFE